MRYPELFQDSFRTRNLWLHLSRMDLLSRFRGTVLGLFWLIFSQVGTFTITAYIWSNLFNLDFNKFLIYIGAGFAIWGFVSNTIVLASSSIFAAPSMYLNSLTPMTMGASRTVATNFYIMAIGMVIPIFMSIYMYGFNFQHQIFFLLGTLEVLILVFVLSVFLSIISIKFKDLTQGLGMIFQVFWTITPVIYTEDMLKSHGLGFVSDLNPFYWALYCMREPWLSLTSLDLSNYFKLGGIDFFLLIFIAFFYKKSSRGYLLYV